MGCIVYWLLEHEQFVTLNLHSYRWRFVCERKLKAQCASKCISSTEPNLVNTLDSVLELSLFVWDSPDTVASALGVIFP